MRQPVVPAVPRTVERAGAAYELRRAHATCRARPQVELAERHEPCRWHALLEQYACALHGRQVAPPAGHLTTTCARAHQTRSAEVSASLRHPHRVGWPGQMRQRHHSSCGCCGMRHARSGRHWKQIGTARPHFPEWRRARAHPAGKCRLLASMATNISSSRRCRRIAVHIQRHLPSSSRFARAWCPQHWCGAHL